LLQLLSIVTSILPSGNFHTYNKSIVNRLMNLKESIRIPLYNRVTSPSRSIVVEARRRER
jgi:hypothetical protein